ncbi:MULTISPECIES: ribonuclease HII [Bacillus]|uniref:ribonuclease HII n=1 Tax=Bacillus TaxID=1386 RepID=UPI000C7764B4|nr:MULTISPECIES: ribonuclease HII [Bacillus]PLR87487.1 ribonuclease HII [Bacillus sp. V33-4]RSK51705.1 ribonuclease HII [Bacillus canaveralius]
MKNLTIAEIEKKLFHLKRPPRTFINHLKEDDRAGVQVLLAKWLRLEEQKKLAQKKFALMSQHEKRIHSEGFQLIAGIDEVGRGPLAGPVVAAAVILPDDFYLPGIDDSKKLTEQKREEYDEYIRSYAVNIGIGRIEAEEIDRINIYEATKKAMLSAVAQLNPKPDYLLIDAVKLETPYPYEAIIKGDGSSMTIAAASIVAKVYRDRLMKEASIQYPHYHFSKNMGYGTKEHLEAIQTYGISPYHRKSFAPVRDWK